MTIDFFIAIFYSYKEELSVQTLGFYVRGM